MPKEIRTTTELMAPNGRICERIMTQGWSNANIDKVDENGWVDDYSCGDFPDMERYDCHGENLLSDSEGGSWLEKHCRLVTILGEDGCVPYDLAEHVMSLHAWPDDVIAECIEAMNMHEALAGVAYMRNLLPTGMQSDDTINAAVNTLVVGRLTDRLERSNAIIDTYRKTQSDAPILLDIDALTEEFDNAET